MGKVDESVYFCGISVQINPFHLNGYINCAQLLTQINRYGDALEILKQALSQFGCPTNTNKESDLSIVNQCLGSFYDHVGDLDNAKHHYEQSVMLNPRIMQNWVLLALLEKRMQRYDNCMQICE